MLHLRRRRGVKSSRKMNALSQMMMISRIPAAVAGHCVGSWTRKSLPNSLALFSAANATLSIDKSMNLAEQKSATTSSFS